MITSRSKTGHPCIESAQYITCRGNILYWFVAK